jgi:hypothetical protein
MCCLHVLCYIFILGLTAVTDPEIFFGGGSNNITTIFLCDFFLLCYRYEINTTQGRSQELNIGGTKFKMLYNFFFNKKCRIT